MKKSITLSLLIFLINAQSLISQNIDTKVRYRKAKEYIYNVEKLKSLDSVTWYGWDYSNLILNDHNVNAAEIKSKWIPYWHLKMDHTKFGTKRFKKRFKKNNLKIDYRTIQGLVSKVNDSKLVDIYRYPITLDSLPSVVKKYDLANNSGIGITSIVTEMRKSDITVMIYTVFFDINTKEIIYVVKSRGKAGDKGGLGRFYNKGLILGMKAFHKKYNKTRKSFK